MKAYAFAADTAAAASPPTMPLRELNRATPGEEGSSLYKMRGFDGRGRRVGHAYTKKEELISNSADLLRLFRPWVQRVDRHDARRYESRRDSQAAADEYAAKASVAALRVGLSGCARACPLPFASARHRLSVNRPLVGHGYRVRRVRAARDQQKVLHLSGHEEETPRCLSFCATRWLRRPIHLPASSDRGNNEGQPFLMRYVFWGRCCAHSCTGKK